MASLRHVVLCEGNLPGEATLQTLSQGRPGEYRAREMEREDPAAILYTSGTPRRLRFVDAVPKSATGKILKRVLREEGA